MPLIEYLISLVLRGNLVVAMKPNCVDAAAKVLHYSAIDVAVVKISTHGMKNRVDIDLAKHLNASRHQPGQRLQPMPDGFGAHG